MSDFVDNDFVDSYFKECLAVIDSIKEFTIDVDGVKRGFKLMILTDKCKEEIESCQTYEEMISMAANHGICFNEERVIDGVLTHKLKGLWAKDELNNLEELSTQDLVGVEVCRISGLSDFIAAQRTKETEYNEQQTSINESTDTSLSIEECAANVAAANL